MIAAGRCLAVALFAAATGAQAACFVSSFTLSFGAVNASAPADSVGDVAVTCNDAPGAIVRYGVSLSAGSAGTFAPRRMRSSSGAMLQYNLYADPARSTVWGDGTGGSVTVNEAFSIGASSVTKHYPVYARIFARQSVPAGAYDESVLVTLNF